MLFNQAAKVRFSAIAASFNTTLQGTLRDKAAPCPGATTFGFTIPTHETP